MSAIGIQHNISHKLSQEDKRRDRIPPAIEELQASHKEEIREGERIRKVPGIGIVAMWTVIKVEIRMEVVEIEETKKRKWIKMRWNEDRS